jgi:hypothetical protein
VAAAVPAWHLPEPPAPVARPFLGLASARTCMYAHQRQCPTAAAHARTQTHAWRHVAMQHACMQEQLQNESAAQHLSQSHLYCWRTLAVTLELFPSMYRKCMFQLALVPAGTLMSQQLLTVCSPPLRNPQMLPEAPGDCDTSHARRFPSNVGTLRQVSVDFSLLLNSVSGIVRRARVRCAYEAAQVCMHAAQRNTQAIAQATRTQSRRSFGCAGGDLFLALYGCLSLVDDVMQAGHL